VALTFLLTTALVLLWLVLSGQWSALLVTFGVLSAALVAWVARRMRITDSEGVPVHLLPGLIIYGAWLVKEIFVANVQVAAIVLSPRLPIHPRIVHFRAHQRTDLGRVLFANSITLTPGTITTGIEGDDLRIHALHPSFLADHDEDRVMDRKVANLEGGA